jgi:hypothetical protein
VEIDDGFEDTPVGNAPLDAVVNVEGKGDSIAVSADTAATGSHSLKIVTVPNLEHNYNPHLYYMPHQTSGIATLSFDLRVEPGAKIYDEWRDSAQPYRSGPHLEIVNGRLLTADGKILTTIPMSEWVHFTITAGLGTSSTGTWDLTVAAPGQSPQKFAALADVSEAWKTLDWLGFANIAPGASVYYLDNVKISNSQTPK